jgi:hypothetical protein
MQSKNNNFAYFEDTDNNYTNLSDKDYLIDNSVLENTKYQGDFCFRDARRYLCFITSHSFIHL